MVAPATPGRSRRAIDRLLADASCALGWERPRATRSSPYTYEAMLGAFEHALAVAQRRGAH